jgi:hypothetical protein
VLPPRAGKGASGKDIGKGGQNEAMTMARAGPVAGARPGGRARANRATARGPKTQDPWPRTKGQEPRAKGQPEPKAKGKCKGWARARAGQGQGPRQGQGLGKGKGHGKGHCRQGQRYERRARKKGIC